MRVLLSLNAQQLRIGDKNTGLWVTFQIKTSAADSSFCFINAFCSLLWRKQSVKWDTWRIWPTHRVAPDPPSYCRFGSFQTLTFADEALLGNGLFAYITALGFLERLQLEGVCVNTLQLVGLKVEKKKKEGRKEERGTEKERDQHWDSWIGSQWKQSW